jgi:hypothetical protein
MTPGPGTCVSSAVSVGVGGGEESIVVYAGEPKTDTCKKPSRARTLKKYVAPSSRPVAVNDVPDAQGEVPSTVEKSGALVQSMAYSTPPTPVSMDGCHETVALVPFVNIGSGSAFGGSGGEPS